MKRFLVALVVCLAMSSVAMAAPMTNLNNGETAAGYLYWNPKITVDGRHGYSYDVDKENSNGVYIETAISDKFILGIETIKGDTSKTVSGVVVGVDTRFTDFTVQYKLDNNVRLIVGNRNYDTILSAKGYGSTDVSTNKFIYGIGASTPMGDKTSVYATFLHDSYADEWQLGVNQNLSKNAMLNINYRYHDEDDILLKGIGAGLIYKF